MTAVVIGAAMIGPRYRPPSSTELPSARSRLGNQRRRASTEAGQSAAWLTPSAARMAMKEP